MNRKFELGNEKDECEIDYLTIFKHEWLCTYNKFEYESYQLSVENWFWCECHDISSVIKLNIKKQLCHKND